MSTGKSFDQKTFDKELSEQAKRLLKKGAIANDLIQFRKNTPKAGRFPIPKQSNTFLVAGVAMIYKSHTEKLLTMRVDKAITVNVCKTIPNMLAIELEQSDISILGYSFKVERVKGYDVTFRPVGPTDEIEDRAKKLKAAI